MKRKRIGIVGARGHTGVELIRLVDAHEGMELAFVSSRELAGQEVADQLKGHASGLRYASLDADSVASEAIDAVVLALPNSVGTVCEGPSAADGPAIVDLSADHRSTRAGTTACPLPGAAMPGNDTSAIRAVTRPQCNWPSRHWSICSPVRRNVRRSGYSGAGTTPSIATTSTSARQPHPYPGGLYTTRGLHHLGVPLSSCRTSRRTFAASR